MKIEISMECRWLKKKGIWSHERRKLVNLCIIIRVIILKMVVERRYF